MKIALIDDKDFGCTQIQKSFPRPDIALCYFDSVNKFLEQKEFFDILFLDFYLEKDGITGDTVVQKLLPLCDILIGFSSSRRGNEKMRLAGVHYTFEKQWDTKNEALEHFFMEII